jgi:hypothetical protein
MKIIEALKKLKVIEKRIARNCADINKYASVLDSEKPAFVTEEAQKDEVNKLIQSCEDLGKEYLKLKSQIEATNLSVKATVGGCTYSLSELLVIKRKLAKMMEPVYAALNKDAAEKHMLRGYDRDQKAQVIQLYDETVKNENLRKWQELYEEIDSRLEVINATEDLVEV